MLFALALPCVAMILFEVFRWELIRFLRNAKLPDWTEDLLVLTPAYLCVVLLGMGILLFTVREGYPPADQADRKRRLLIRACMIAPVVGLVFVHLSLAHPGTWWNYMPSVYHLLAPLCLTIGMAPLPLLLFTQLRDLGRRARSAHLVEHCRIVGIGMCLALLYCAAMFIFQWYGENLRSNARWWERSFIPILVFLIGSVAASLFVLWGVYLLVRFALAFRRASKHLRRKWAGDDRATIP